MNGMHYNKKFPAKRVVEVAGGGFSSPSAKFKKNGSFTNYEPISVLDTRSPSPSTSTSTFSSFNTTTQQGSVAIAAAADDGGDGGRKEDVMADLQPGHNTTGLELTNGVSENFHLGVEDWESLLSESEGQDSLLRWISTGDVDESSLSLKQLLLAGNSNETQGNVGCFGAIDSAISPLQQKPMLVPKQEVASGSGEQMVAPHCQQLHQQNVNDQLYKAAELILAGNFSNAQGILARLNQVLSPIGKPFQRTAFYLKEALHLALLMPNMGSPLPRIPTPFDVMFKMGAYKIFSEVSPLVQFMNFTANQVILEALDNAEEIHIIDFDIGFGAQWSSFMQELPRSGQGAPSLKITAFASPSTHHAVELSLMHENLTQFANDLHVNFNLEVMNIDSFDPNSNSLSSFRSSKNETIVVNFPIWSMESHLSVLPSLLCFIKKLSPKIMVSLDRGCDRTDLPFSGHILNSLQYYEALLNSIEATNMASDSINKVEKFLFQPRIETTVLGRLRAPNLMPPWSNLFASAGFFHTSISNFAETQAECVVKRSQVKGFHVEKQRSSLVLCWQHHALMSVTAWRC
ncbi:scarecrow-like protein 6 isoform X2 [Olea europaea var. sylvestris]|uniref:scarecrow-like protein 6 isoform X2 n=1 Tax=Olea europaea var. sylvestris TaxID=158386 RepID=UPI000C1D6ACC|nr:scarecrow-like protein 6 isoform X2 [Olea europaea var. sylvestris]